MNKSWSWCTVCAYYRARLTVVFLSFSLGSHSYFCTKWWKSSVLPYFAAHWRQLRRPPCTSKTYIQWCTIATQSIACVSHLHMPKWRYVRTVMYIYLFRAKSLVRQQMQSPWMLKPRLHALNPPFLRNSMLFLAVLASFPLLEVSSLLRTTSALLLSQTEAKTNIFPWFGYAQHTKSTSAFTNDPVIPLIVSGGYNLVSVYSWVLGATGHILTYSRAVLQHEPLM